MVYLVTANAELFKFEDYSIISPDESLQMIHSWDYIQFDTETKGVDARISPVLCAQFGNKTANAQIVVDCTTIDLSLYKDELENHLVIGQNLYFDLQFLFNYGIIPLLVYDTMIAEQLLYLGFPPVSKGGPRMSLQAILDRRFHIYLSKEVRGQIRYRGLDSKVIEYAANDVVYLEDIMWQQIAECQERGCMEALRIECNFVPVLAYCTWCGIKLDEKLWREKMAIDSDKLNSAIKGLNEFVINTGNPKFINTEIQLSLFEEPDYSPKSDIIFSVPGTKAPKGNKEKLKQFIASLGFDISVIDKKTKEDKDSIDIKVLQKQKGINDEFLKLYSAYSEAYKVVSTYGITYINAINPLTGRIHTSFKQLAADTGRIACGNIDEADEEKIKINPDLAQLKGMPIDTKDITKVCGYPNIQTLPADEMTRSSFICEDGNLFCSCDWSAIESRLGADIYQEKAMIEEFLHGSGDMHSLVAKMVFPELKDVPIKDIKKLYPKLRSAAKPIEFSQQFGGSAEAIRNNMGCSMEQAEAFAKAYNDGFKGIAKFKQVGSKFVRNNGYILLNPITGHRTVWWDWDVWKKRQAKFTPEFWEDYRLHHKGTKDEVAKLVGQHFKAASKWDRKALNSVTQGTGAICLKVAGRIFFEWIVANGYFGKIKIVDFVHDEICIEYPKELDFVAKKLETTMEETAAIYCKSLPIPAEASVSTHWVH